MSITRGYTDSLCLSYLHSGATLLLVLRIRSVILCHDDWFSAGLVLTPFQSCHKDGVDRLL